MGVKILKMIKDLNLQIINEGDSEKTIGDNDLNRAGLQFAGYYDYFVYRRLQIMGMAEWSFLDKMEKEIRKENLERFFEYDIPCVVISRNITPHEELLEAARKNNVWLLRWSISTTRLINKLINYLDRELAPRTSIHGNLMDVYGVGILITGCSGIGKSEISLELINRRHLLVADDAVDIRCIDGVLYGKSPYVTSGMLEVRGMGIIDVTALYGVSCMMEEKNIDLVIELEKWIDGKDYERLGDGAHTTEILGVPLRKISIPLRPGRNLAVIIEAAAADFRYKLISKESPVNTIEKRIEEAEKIE